MAHVSIRKEGNASAPPAPISEKKAEEAAKVSEGHEFGTVARAWLRPFDIIRRILRWVPFEPAGPLRLWGEGLYAPGINVKETKGAFVVKADVPGIEVKDLEVQLVHNRLTVSGHREEEKSEEGDKYYAYERSAGSFCRAFTLPEGANLEKLGAELKDGVLTITIPKVAEPPAKRIDIRS